jgi:predicted alpha/beta-hydrolase family hydrolase
VTIHLAHGASGDATSMAPHVAGLKARGLEAQAIGLPVGKAERAVDRYREQVADLPAAVIGGHSYGGRVASLLAAQEGHDSGPRALVLLSYPLHRPGRPEIEGRVDHWPSIGCPVLLLSGDADPFARVGLLREAVARLPHGELFTYPRLGHGLKPVLDDALDRVAEFVRNLPASRAG